MRRLLLLLSLLLEASASDLASDKAALVALRTSLRGRSLLWNDTTPVCNWQGIVCNHSRVTEIHMPGRSLFGALPNNVLGNLSELTFLSLRFNSLTGTLPDDLPSLTQLHYLYLQGNDLSGPVPAPLFLIPSLLRINIADNNLSGPIPDSFNKLSQLSTLYLEGNRLSGQIPDLDSLTNLKQFNVSGNLLNGTIPEKLATFPASSFAGNSLCGPPLLSCSNTNGTAGSGSGSGNGSGKKKLSKGAIAGIVVAAVVLAILLLLCLICVCCMRKGEKKDETKSREVNAAQSVAPVGKDDLEVQMAAAEAPKETTAGVVAPIVPVVASKGAVSNNKSLVFFGNGPRIYDLEDLLRASAEVLGKGTYGTTYKAALDSGVAVAVKRLKDVVVSEEEFKARMEEIGRLDHLNLVALRAYHANGANERLLVYDYLPIGSLSALLHGNRGAGRTPLNWETRSMIALGTARGIQYIHTQGPTVSHGNIKSSNVLLSNNYEARVSDFGLAQVVSPTAAPNRVAGYRAPEVTDPRRVSQKADVYSFGVFLLELLTGKAPIVNEEGVDLPRWVQSVVREEWSSEVFDVELLRYQNVEEEMVQLLQLAIDCTAQYPDNRPLMADVTSRIEQICRSTSAKTEEQGAEESL